MSINSKRELLTGSTSRRTLRNLCFKKSKILRGESRNFKGMQRYVATGEKGSGSIIINEE